MTTGTKKQEHHTTTARTTTGGTVTLDSSTIDAFAASLHGDLLLPDHPDYESARRVWNGMIDKHPALIIRCQSTADVVAAVNFAREHQLVLAVRGGGHNTAGNATCDDSLVIDLSPMCGVEVDPDARIAHAQGGATYPRLVQVKQQYDPSNLFRLNQNIKPDTNARA